MSTLRIVVPGEPIPQPRHRVGVGFGDRPRAYIKATHPVHTWKLDVARCARLAVGNRDPADFALSVEILFVMPRRKSYGKSHVHEWHAKKPDADNLGKSTLDALRGIVYTDDSLIVSAQFSKTVARSGFPPGAYIVFRVCGDAHETVTAFLSQFS